MFTLTLKTVHPRHQTRVKQSSHMHRVPAEPPAVNAMVHQNMPIIAVVMPALQVVVVF